MRIEVAYAKPEEQALLSLEMAEGACVGQAIRDSGILRRFPEIDLAAHAVGIFGKVCRLEQTLHDGDRVEIYRPLLADPREARRNRAAKR
jgi:hypothetical protein